MIERVYYRVKLNTDQIIYSQYSNAELEAKLNENIVKDPSKTYLVWKGDKFPNSTDATFKAPEGCTIDWGDGNVETFETASIQVNMHTYTDGFEYHLISLSNYTVIDNSAFYNCSGLTNVIIGTSVTSIGGSAFRYCSGLTSVTIGNGVTFIEIGVFGGCSGLTSVTIGNGVTAIGVGAFYDCSGLTSVTIPDSVTSIRDGAFSSCSGLKTIKISAINPPTLGYNAFETSLEKIIVPKSSIDAYKSADGWSDYADKIVYEVDSSDIDLIAQFGALNIENGTGVKSIQQKFDPKYNGVVKAATKNPYAKVLYPELTDAEPIGAIGDYAASFGGNSSVQAKRGIGGGTSSVTKGAYSQSLGDNTVTTPKASDSTAIGYQTTTDAPGAFTHGSYTVVMSQKYIEGMFDPSVEPGQGGSGQPTEPGTTPADTLEMDTRRGEAASAGGFNSYASGFAAEVDGVSNVADGHISKSSGRSNRSWSYLSKTDGKNSVVKPDEIDENATGEGSWANGNNVQITGAKYAYSGGTDNKVFAGADNSFSYGEGLQAKNKNQTVIGQYNDSNSNDLFVVGVGTGENNRKNSFRATKDGKLYYGDFEVSNLKTTNDAIVNLDNKLSPKINSNTTEITNLCTTIRDTNTNLNNLNETKYDKTGGTIGGNVIITGDLTVNGTQHINNTENLNVENAMIYSNSDGATLALLGGLGIKKNATDVYGIVYDRTSDSVKLGLGKSDANGVFTFNEGEGQPVAIRDDSSKFTNNNLVKWDSENHKLVDAGKNVENLVDKLPASLRNQAYVRNANGEDSGLAYTYTDEGNTLAVRNASGQVQVSTPLQDKDAANKSYADNLTARYVSTSILGG